MSSGRAKAARVWRAMREMFGSTWASQYGAVPNDTWMRALARLTDAQLVNGLNTVAQSNREFPPTLPQFIEHCAYNRPPHLRHDAEPSYPMLEDQGKRDRAKRAREKWIPHLRAALRGATE